MRIQQKLFLTLLSTCICLVILMFAFMRWSVDRGMLEYVNTREANQLAPILQQLANSYEHYQGWENIPQPRHFFRQLLHQQRQLHGRDHDNKPPKEPYDSPKSRPPNIAILNAQQQLVFGRYHNSKDYQLLPIRSQQQIVGWLARPQKKFISKGFELAFVEKQTETLALISLLVCALAMLISFPLARHFVNPIRQLTHALHRLTQGDYQNQQDTQHLQQRRDELGGLAQDIHSLAATLNKNEQLRKQWLADTSHELRTPVSILLAEIEAMLDEIRPITKNNLQSLQQETLQLKKLIDDLHTLNSANLGSLHYHKQNTDLCALIQQQCDLHQQSLKQKSIGISCKLPSQAIHCYIDRSRIAQLLDNILANCKHYCPANSEVLITVRSEQQQAIIDIADNGPGVPDEALAHLFDSLYRVEHSRNRSTGGSGLGLAICQRIVAAHDGHIVAKHAAQGGLLIEITLPLSST
ncbi:ATP-binding protein [Dasania sp. GY-MA-18]|uniref:histidine kinase n=1 Tax=Dasania phycosphaerae TaxID=2950436 RepID=A0A9J6RI44_9GAMM|nr:MULTISPECIES: ATP-binding protein [Dasania]MCR8921508.1 ATP-binding protein [Dasania sp. GY-MA-18]MCZ0863936.1 ATP-binding protein [Dasania phycosphaerae]MCZ0867664.1 ATP-binding protein [Dasania phycosphaerae]